MKLSKKQGFKQCSGSPAKKIQWYYPYVVVTRNNIHLRSRENENSMRKLKKSMKLSEKQGF